MDQATVLQKRRNENFSEELEKKGWYRSFDLPDGRVIKGYLTSEELRERFSEFPFASELRGKRVLDIGTWDGWFAFESERLGANVVAVDIVEQPNFHVAHRALKSTVKYEVAEVYELPARKLGTFDYTLFLGVLYHLRHPLRALEIVCALTKEIAIVDSFIVDDDYRGGGSPIPWMEFYETTELSNQIDNWVGPTLECLLALCRSAGFARVELLSIKYRHARVACYRHWEPAPERPTATAPILTAAVNGRWSDNGVNFHTNKEEFLTVWFTSDELIRREDLRIEVSGLGSNALALKQEGTGQWQASVYVPTGLRPGWHDVRVRSRNSAFSNTRRIAVDIPVVTAGVEIRVACDGRTWKPGEVQIDPAEVWGHLAVHVSGLAENRDRNNVRVFCGSRRLPVDFVSQPDSEGTSQVNVRAPADLLEGELVVDLEHGGLRAMSASIQVKSDSA